MKANNIKYVAALWTFMLIISTNGYSRTISCNGNVYTLSSGDLSFSVSSEAGGRIISFRKGDVELLTSDTVNPVYYGATFWLSPQANYWPVYPTVDKLPYKASVEENRLLMVSQTDENNIRITKEFSISEPDTAIYINYKIENTSEHIRKLAPWDVSRVYGGLTFFPVGEENKKINKSHIQDAYIEDDILWYPFAQKRSMPAQKLFNTAKDGWMAHYYKNLLFVKCFPDILPQDIPSGQGEVEIFVAPEGKYLELENHGKYVELQPGQTILYKQKWFLLIMQSEDRVNKDILLKTVGKLNKSI